MHNIFKKLGYFIIVSIMLSLCTFAVDKTMAQANYYNEPAWYAADSLTNSHGDLLIKSLNDNVKVSADSGVALISITNTDTIAITVNGIEIQGGLYYPAASGTDTAGFGSASFNGFSFTNDSLLVWRAGTAYEITLK